VVDAADDPACQTALIDGEMVVQDERGVSDFYGLRSSRPISTDR
jgi:ATP-dependent DNA ligase